MVKVRSRFLRPMSGSMMRRSYFSQHGRVFDCCLFLRSAFEDVEMRQEGEESVLRLSK